MKVHTAIAASLTMASVATSEIAPPNMSLWQHEGVTPNDAGEARHRVYDMIFTEVNSCEDLSEAYAHISIGVPVSAAKELQDTTLPDGLYWPSFRQKDGSVISIKTALPPPEWGVEYIARTDGQSRKQFYFYHDRESITRIVYAPLNLSQIPPHQFLGIEGIGRSAVEPIGPLIIMERETEPANAAYR